MRLDVIAAQMGDALPELKTQLDNAAKIISDYFFSSVEDTPLSLVDPEELIEVVGNFFSNFVSNFSAIDNTEILFNLFSNSSLQDSKESKTYESLIDTIRAKLKTTDDSILQKVMSRISNAPKSAEASA